MKKSVSPIVMWGSIAVVVIIGLLVWIFTVHPIESPSGTSINKVIQAGLPKPISATPAGAKIPTHGTTNK